jgi:hypothetical protein
MEAHAMASILDPESPYAADGLFGWSGQRTFGQQLMRVEPKILYPAADNLRFIPRLMYALMHSTRRELAGVLGDAQPMPNTWKGTPLRVIVREDIDQEIKVHILGVVVQTNGVEVQAFGPAGTLIRRTTVPPGRHSAFAITLPKDGQTGQYVLLVSRGKQSDDLSLPLTTLPEVFLVNEWGTASARPGQFFTRSAGAEAVELAIGGETTRVFSADKRTLLGFTDKVQKAAKVSVGPEGAWICGFGGAVFNSRAADGAPVTVSTSPERWFVPGAAALAVQPVP